jgi:hypothetical protein
MQKDEEVAVHRNKYAGSQAERSSKAAADAEAQKVAKQLKDSKLSGNCLDLFILLWCWLVSERKNFYCSMFGDIRNTKFMLLVTIPL